MIFPTIPSLPTQRRILNPSLSRSLRQMTMWLLLDTLFLRFRIPLILRLVLASSALFIDSSSSTLCSSCVRRSLHFVLYGLQILSKCSPLPSALVTHVWPMGQPLTAPLICVYLTSSTDQRHCRPYKGRLRSLTYIPTHTPTPAWLMGQWKQKKILYPVAIVTKYVTHQ